MLEPALHRESWGWDRRHQDFDLYTQPPPFLELPPPPAPKPRTGNRGRYPFCLAATLLGWEIRIRGGGAGGLVSQRRLGWNFWFQLDSSLAV